ncbi:MAG TPA: hypothetical protein VHZ81_00760 [Galbitalea sp.]|nr:hypothetical protein [Galbitalea sp.]
MKKRAGALVAVAAAVGLTLSGCAVVSVPQHVTDTAIAAHQLAEYLKKSPGVTSASAAYDPADSSGESVRVKVRLKSESGADDWIDVLRIARTALTSDPLGQTRRFLDVAQSGDSGPSFTPQQFTNWPAAAAVKKSFIDWTAVEQSTGMHLRFELASGTTPVPYLSTSKAESKRFMADTTTRASVPANVELYGYGFATTSAPPPDAKKIYELLIRSLPPLGPPVDSTFVAPTHQVFTVTWDPLGLVANFYTPMTAAGHPTTAVASLAVELADAVPPATLAVTWSDGNDAAWVTFGACPKPFKLTATAGDRAFAAQITATGYSLPSSGGPGQCLP